MEIWKDVPNYEGIYQASNLGRIKQSQYNHILKPILHNRYYCVGLSKDGKVKQYRLHRLIAETFIPNPDNLPQVNHKDENKLNNNVDNLEWCDSKYNNNYGTKGARISKTKMGHTVSEETKQKIRETLKKTREKDGEA